MFKNLPDSKFVAQRFTVQKGRNIGNLASVTLHELVDAGDRTQCGLFIGALKGRGSEHELVGLSAIQDTDWKHHKGRAAEYTHMCRKCSPGYAKELSNVN